jgi:hypothetical protein
MSEAIEPPDMSDAELLERITQDLTRLFGAVDDFLFKHEWLARPSVDSRHCPICGMRKDVGHSDQCGMAELNRALQEVQS